MKRQWKTRRIGKIRTRKSPAAVTLFSIRAQRQALGRSFSSRLRASGSLDVGVPLLAIRYSTTKDTPSDDRDANDRMATFAQYSSCLTTSGTVWCRAPIVVVLSNF